MFDVSSWKLILLAVIALIVVGPKDLPMLLRTIGKYLGMIKRQAAEFRTQFDDAIRESELAELKKEVETLGQEARDKLSAAERSVEAEIRSMETELDRAVGEIDKPEADRAAAALEAEAAVALAAPAVDEGATIPPVESAPAAPAIAHPVAPVPAQIVQPQPPKTESTLEFASDDRAPRSGA